MNNKNLKLLPSLVLLAGFFAEAPVLAAEAQVAGDDSTAFTSPLAMPEEIYSEKMVIEMMASPAVQAARGEARELMSKHPIAESADARQRIDHSLDHWMAQLATQIVGSDLSTPRIVWNATISDFSWFDVDFPGSGSGIDCPDNVYRTLALNGTTEYELTGKVYENRAAQFSFQLTPHPGFDGFWTTDDFQDIATITMLTNRDIDVDENGEFSIFIGPGHGNGRKNYIQMPKGKNILLIRDTLSDWRQVPNHLSVRRVGGDPLPGNAMNVDDFSSMMVEGAKQNVTFWLRYIHDFLSKAEPNKLVKPYGRQGAFGLASGTRYKLDADQAYVVTVRNADANYMGMQLSDLWGIAFSPTEHISSYNESQARKNADGTLTFIISREDPGFGNWVDTVGSGRGWVFFRWQGLEKGITGKDLIVDERVVSMKDLRQGMTVGTEVVSVEKRQQAMAERKSLWERRIAVSTSDRSKLALSPSK